MLSLSLFEPEIPGNAGNVARLCAATGAPLHLIGRLGFSLRHPDARRAGMDYWADVRLHRHLDYDAFERSLEGGRVWMFSTRGSLALWDVPFQTGDTLLFGPESRGLPAGLLELQPDRIVRIPMVPEARSLNLATSAGIALYEGLRKVGWRGAAG